MGDFSGALAADCPDWVAGCPDWALWELDSHLTIDENFMGMVMYVAEITPRLLRASSQLACIGLIPRDQTERTSEFPRPRLLCDHRRVDGDPPDTRDASGVRVSRRVTR